jgi:hypothetical protein
MPTYGPDGSIRLDSENTIGTGGVGPHGGPATGRHEAGMYSDELFRDDVSAIEGLQAGRGYEHYEPGFRYGWESAERHRGRAWTDAEGDLEQDWRTRHPDRDWHEYRGSIRHAFDKAMHVFEGGKDPDKR